MEGEISAEPAPACATWDLFRRQPAKPAPSHDAWFAGFTSNLLCVVWVGNDDYTDVKLEGADAAAPIWAAFMKKAVQLPQYSDTHEFTPPDGVQIVSLDKATNLLSDAACPDDYDAAFLDGTAPTDTCDHPPDHRNISSEDLWAGQAEQLSPQLNHRHRSVGHRLAVRHQKVTRASGPWMRRRIGSPQRRQGSPVRP